MLYTCVCGQCDDAFQMRDKEALTRCKKLKLFSCKLPNNFWDEVPELRILYMTGCDMEALPAMEEHIHLQHLEELHIDQCHRLCSLPDKLFKLHALKVLGCEDCSSLSSLPHDLWGAKLAELSLRGCSSLEALPAIPGSRLVRLESLGLRDCRKLGSLPDNIGQLDHLKELWLQGCSSLERVPESLGTLRRLQTLNLQECTKLQSCLVTCHRCLFLPNPAAAAAAAFRPN